jgi:hypothetical protein
VPVTAFYYSWSFKYKKVYNVPAGIGDITGETTVKY